MSDFDQCPFCGGLNIRIANEREAYDGGYRWWCYEADVICECGALLHVDHGNKPSDGKWDTDETEFDFAVEAWNTRHVDGSMSDGYHTFDELYYHRTALFACLVSIQPRQMAFKSRVHADGTMYPGYFIAGIYTSRGWCTYHVEDKWWPLFDCSELIEAPEWDGHTPSDAIHRLMHDMLPPQAASREGEES